MLTAGPTCGPTDAFTSGGQWDPLGVP